MALEYLIIIGLALTILTGFLIMTFYYASGYNSAESGQGVVLAVNTISNAVDSLASAQLGSAYGFSFVSSGFDQLASYFCANYITLSSSGYQAAATVNLPVYGEIPLNPGQYSGRALLTNINGEQEVQISFNLLIATINTTYVLNGSALLYNISFLSQSNTLVNNVNFELKVYTLTNTFIAAQNETAVSGKFSGHVNINHAYPNLKIMVLVPSYGVANTECIGSSAQARLSIINFQSSATPSPFQQTVTINSSEFSKYESTNLQNVQFSYPNGTVIPSWLESSNLASFNTPLQSPFAWINVSNSSLLKPTSALTVSGWANLRNLSDVGGVLPLALFSNEWANRTSGIMAYIKNGELYFFANLSSSGRVNISTNISTLGITVNQWFNYVATYSAATGKFMLYINGEPEATKTVPTSQSIVYVPSSKFIIGAFLPGAGCILLCLDFIFNGSMANLQMYSSALASSQISALYSEGMGGQPVSTASLLAWWPLSGNANDLSGNGNSGIPIDVVFSAVGSGSTGTRYWLRLGSLPADSTTEILMDFYPTDFNVFNNKITGEAPQLSSTYGKYDNGVNIFNYYTNFSGTSLPSGWTTSSSLTATVSNGVKLASSAGSQYLGYNTAVNSPFVFEIYGKVTTATTVDESNLLAIVSSSLGGATDWAGEAYSSGDVFGYGIAGNWITTSTSWSIGTFYLNGVGLTSSGVSDYVNYNLLGSSTSSGGLSSAYLEIWQDNSTTFVQWLRTRAYPPNGVMPYVIVGGVQ